MQPVLVGTLDVGVGAVPFGDRLLLRAAKGDRDLAGQPAERCVVGPAGPDPLAAGFSPGQRSPDARRRRTPAGPRRRTPSRPSPGRRPASRPSSPGRRQPWRRPPAWRPRRPKPSQRLHGLVRGGDRPTAAAQPSMRAWCSASLAARTSLTVALICCLAVGNFALAISSRLSGVAAFLARPILLRAVSISFLAGVRAGLPEIRSCSPAGGIWARARLVWVVARRRHGSSAAARRKMGGFGLQTG